MTYSTRKPPHRRKRIRMDYTDIRYEVAERIATVTLHRPEG